jgi:hypothetical protein
MRTIFILAIAAISIANTGRRQPPIASMEHQWGRLNEECRGGSHTPDDAVCTRRDRVGEALQRRGICYSYSDWRVFPVDYDFHPCSQTHPKGWVPDPEFR